MIHDHFDGSAHCVECEGPCRLQGDDRLVTNLVRWVIEFSAVVHKGWMWDFMTDALRQMLGHERLKEFHKRARQGIQQGMRAPE